MILQSQFAALDLRSFERFSRDDLVADILDNKTSFTIVMGCDGCGKTTWKRANRDALAAVHIDLDSIAEGIGNWDSEASRTEALQIGEDRIRKAIVEHAAYGVESAYSGERGVNQVDEARSQGYRIHGHYLSTDSPQVNIERINQRVRERMGHRVNPDLIPTRWRYSLSNLRKTVDWFDELTIYDNSAEYDLGCEDPPRLAFFERGRVSMIVAEELRPEWFRRWYAGWEDRQMSLERQERKQKKAP